MNAKRALAAITLISFSTACAPKTQTIVGPAGRNGIDAAPCTVTPEPDGALVTCGTSSVFISNGRDGHDGHDGSNGRDGTAGRDGTDIAPVSVVQLCPNVTTYPNTFSEIGICISNKLYGVYSANDGFLTYLPPGQYSSAGINSSCTFTVTEGCAVTR